MLENLEKRLQAIADKYQPKNAKEVRVGIDNANIAEYATYIEFGWKKTITGKQKVFLSAVSGLDISWGAKLVCEPRPFFRATFAYYNRQWTKLFAKNVVALGVEQALKFVGSAIQTSLQDTISDGGTPGQKFALRKPLTMRIYANEAANHKTDGTPGKYATTQPLVLSSHLLEHIAFELV